MQEYEAERVELLKLAPVSGCTMVTKKTYLLHKQQKDKQQNWDASASFKLEITPTRKSDFLHVQKYYAIPDEFKIGKQLIVKLVLKRDQIHQCKTLNIRIRGI